METIRAILLGALVFLANAYCPCADAAQTVTTQKRAESKAVASHCHSAPSEKGDRASCPGDSPGGEEHRSHSCSHCNGTVPPDTAKARMTAPDLPLSPMFFAAIPVDVVSVQGPVFGIRFDHCDLPPPHTTSTLLNLACAFNQ